MNGEHGIEVMVEQGVGLMLETKNKKEAAKHSLKFRGFLKALEISIWPNLISSSRGSHGRSLSWGVKDETMQLNVGVEGHLS